MGSTLWAVLFVLLFFDVLSLERNTSRNRISTQNPLNWLEPERHFHKYSTLVNAQRVRVFTCKLLQQCTQVLYVWAYPVMFCCLFCCYILTKEEIVNCKSSSWSERNQLWMQLRIQVRGTTPQIYNRKLQVQFWEEAFLINFTGLSMQCTPASQD